MAHGATPAAATQPLTAAPVSRYAPDMPQQTESVVGYLEALHNPRRDEVTILHELICSVLPGWEPYVSSGMLAYGRYHYRYASGREGDAPIVSLASRKGGVSLYVDCVADDGSYLAERRAAQLAPAKVGRSCVSIRRLSDVDLEAVHALLDEAAHVGPPGHAATPPR